MRHAEYWNISGGGKVGTFKRVKGYLLSWVSNLILD